MTRAMEVYARKKAGPEPKVLSELLASKLRWTFLPQEMERGRRVTRWGSQRLGVELRWKQDGRLKFGFGRDMRAGTPVCAWRRSACANLPVLGVSRIFVADPVVQIFCGEYGKSVVARDSKRVRADTQAGAA